MFHDDQHGTAVVVAAAVHNALAVAGKSLEEVRLVCTGAGAAAIACLELLCELGMRRENVAVADRKGILNTGRDDFYRLSSHKLKYAEVNDGARGATVAEALDGADIFLGLSGPGTVTAEEIARMSADPIVLALANPTPEVLPEDVLAVR